MRMPRSSRLGSSKGMESSPFYLILASIILFLTALVVFPAFNKWQGTMDEGRAVSETEKVVDAVEGVYRLGDVGSTKQVRVVLPSGYLIDVGNSSLSLERGGRTVRSYFFPARLVYRGGGELRGPGRFNVTVIHWIVNESHHENKSFLIEVLR